MRVEATVEVVLFASSFRCSGVRGGTESPNISHALKPDRNATLCGRVGWITDEGLEPADSVCCLRCRRALGFSHVALRPDAPSTPNPEE